MKCIELWPLKIDKAEEVLSEIVDTIFALWAGGVVCVIGHSEQEFCSKLVGYLKGGLFGK
jgi:hypothetical protein